MLSLVMPAFNEEAVIGQVITDYTAVLSNHEPFEIIVVDDCSTDATLAVLQTISNQNSHLRVIESPTNRGHGPALAQAFRAARGENIFHSDSDGQFYAEDFRPLLDALEQNGFDVIVGIRSERRDPFSRLLLTRFLRSFLKIFFRGDFPDSNSPFRIYRRSALDRILPLIPESPLVPSILMLVAASKLRLKIGWLPVRHRARSTGISFLRSWKIFKLVVPAFREVLSFKRAIAKIDQN